MAAVKPDGVGAVEPLEGAAEVGLGKLKQQVIMIVHEHVGMELNFKKGRHFAKQLQKMEAVPIVEEDGSPLIAAGGDVIPCAGVDDSQRSGHVGECWWHPKGLSIVECLALTPTATKGLSIVECSALTPTARIDRASIRRHPSRGPAKQRIIIIRHGKPAESPSCIQKLKADCKNTMFSINPPHIPIIRPIIFLLEFQFIEFTGVVK
jgi:hypothetical protein